MKTLLFILFLLSVISICIFTSCTIENFESPVKPTTDEHNNDEENNAVNEDDDENTMDDKNQEQKSDYTSYVANLDNNSYKNKSYDEQEKEDNEKMKKATCDILPTQGPQAPKCSHPVKGLEKKLQDMIKNELKHLQNQPIKINIDCNNKNISPSKEPIPFNPYDHSLPPGYWGDGLSTVTNSIISTGYGSFTSLGSGPFQGYYPQCIRPEPKKEEKKCKKDEFKITAEILSNPRYLQKGSFLGSTDNAKIQKKFVKENIFNDDEDNTYTYLNEKLISMPQKRYTVSELSNLGVEK